VAVVVGFATGVLPPSATDTAGTIVPAQRYRAPQAQDVQLGTAPAVAGQSASQMSNQLREQLGTERGNVGTERGNVGTERAYQGTERGSVGTERGNVGTERAYQGTERSAQGTERSQH
jgi:hypothetical protein